MKAGFAERDITPETGMEKPGDLFKRYHDGQVHDSCKVRAAVFDDGERRVALVGIDALKAPRLMVLAAREEIQRRCGIAPQAVLIGASHTHSGGPLGMPLPGQYDHASDFVQRLAYEMSPNGDPKYTDVVCQAIVEAVVAADEGKVEAVACVGSGYEDKVAFNRRIKMKNGKTYTHPGKGNPDNVDYAGPIDPEVGVIGVWDRAGDFLGCVVNYACHGTTGPGGTSADWIYYLEQTIRGGMGRDAVVVFLNGACGDVTQVDNLNLSGVGTDRGERNSRFVGTRVGAEVLKVLVSAEPGDLAPLDARAEVLRIPRRTPSPERARTSLELVQQDQSRTAEWTSARENVLLDALLEREPVVDVELQAVQIGPAVFVANAAELFCQLGLDIKAGSPFPFTYPVELANGSVGYVPTEDAFGPHGGGYETRLTKYSNLEVAAGTKIVERSLRLVRGMTPGALLEAPKAKLWQNEWKYGSAPPEVE